MPDTSWRDSVDRSIVCVCVRACICWLAGRLVDHFLWTIYDSVKVVSLSLSLSLCVCVLIVPTPLLSSVSLWIIQ